MSNTSSGGRSRIVDAVAAGAVLVIELLATYGTVDGDPLNPVAGWNVTEPVDVWSFALVAVGCAALYWRRTLPVTTLFVTTAAYSVLLLRDHELGMFLAPMVALFTMATLGYGRFHAALAGVICMSASLWWINARTGDIAEPGTAMLAWVALGVVTLVFFVGSYVAGELVRCHRLLSQGDGAPITPGPRHRGTQGKRAEEAASNERGLR